MAKDDAQKKVYDLDALEAEASGEPFHFRLGGKEYTLPPFNALDKKLLDALNQGDQQVAIEALRMGLGKEDAKTFDATPAKLSTVNELFRQWAKESGIDVGEA